MATSESITIPSQTFVWKHDPSAGDIPAQVYYSSKDQPGPRPIALMFHAGGFVMGSAAMIAKNQIINLLRMGFVVVTPEYRLCPQVSMYDGPMQDAKGVYAWCQDKLPTLLKDATGIEADGQRIVAWGHSAGGNMALSLGSLPNPPKAIVDFYGVKYLRDFKLHQPFAGFAQIPEMPEEHTNKIFEGSQAFQSSSMFVDGKPNLKDARSAWFIMQMKKGASISSLIPDDDYDRVDATTGFSKAFPPTFFLHGTADVFVDHKLAIKAHRELKNLGVETELLLGEGLAHVFDLSITYQDPLFTKYVMPGLEFLRKHV